MMLSISRSPLPSPEMLKEYDNYKPGMGNEVVEWVKDQTRHRQAQEKLTTDGSERRLDRSQGNAFVIALIGLALGAIVSIWNTWAAVIFGLGCCSFYGSDEGPVRVSMLLEEANHAGS